MAETQPDLWIFAYGSLMWRPDFTYVERHRARIAGYHRALCIRSHIYRGTPERPGLVFGLDRGGSCVGVAFLIAPTDRARVLEAVRLRELVTSVYREAEAAVMLYDGRTVTAITYVADPAHEQYVGTLPFDETLRVVRAAEGIAGRNLDYVLNTRAHLDEIGADDDPDLVRLSQALKQPSDWLRPE